jgi:PEP-CTERM motif-containing protein
MKQILVTALCVAVFASVSLAGRVTATDMAPINPGSPDTALFDGSATDCNQPVLLYRFDISSIIADTGNVADADGSFESNVQWTENIDWLFKAIATSADFDEATVTWNSYTGSAADMGYWDAMTPEDTQAYVESGNFGAPQYWAISQATIQSWIDAGGIATLALVRADTYYNSCHWTNYGWDAGQLPALNLTTTPEPATMALLALGGLAFLRRRK